MKILLVEDEPKLATYIKKGLEEQSHWVEIAYDGAVGKRMVSNNSFDLFIIDVNLPLVNGFELCRLIRTKNIKTPIILLTALGTIDDKIAGFESGADDYLVKPFEFRELTARINALHKRSQDITSG